MSKRRKFSAQFKRGAVEQASQPGVSCAQVEPNTWQAFPAMCLV